MVRSLLGRCHRKMVRQFDEIWVTRALYVTAAILILAAFAVPLRADTALIFPPFTEDGYYSLSIARAIAAGRGPVLEGSGLTNGFPPLVTLLQAGAFSGRGRGQLSPPRLLAAFGLVTPFC